MLNNLSEQIRDCYRHAQDCARKAAEETDPNLKPRLFGVRRELAVLSTVSNSTNGWATLPT